MQYYWISSEDGEINKVVGKKKYHFPEQAWMQKHARIEVLQNHSITKFGEDIQGCQLQPLTEHHHAN